MYLAQTREPQHRDQLKNTKVLSGNAHKVCVSIYIVNTEEEQSLKQRASNNLWVNTSRKSYCNLRRCSSVGIAINQFQKYCGLSDRCNL